MLKINSLINNFALAITILKKIDYIEEIDILKGLRNIINDLKIKINKNRFYFYKKII